MEPEMSKKSYLTQDIANASRISKSAKRACAIYKCYISTEKRAMKHILMILTFIFSSALYGDIKLYSNERYNCSFEYSSDFNVVTNDNLSEFKKEDGFFNQLGQSILIVEGREIKSPIIILNEISELMKSEGHETLDEHLAEGDKIIAKKGLSSKRSDVTIGRQKIKATRYIRYSISKHPRIPSKEVHNTFFVANSYNLNLALIVQPIEQKNSLLTYERLLNTLYCDEEI